MNDQELMDAVVAVKSYCDLIGIDNENIDMVVALAERVLSAGETLPEKRDNPVEFITDDVPPQVAYQWGYNQAIDDCRAVIAAHYVSREELGKVKAENDEKLWKLKEEADGEIERLRLSIKDF